MSNRTPVVFNFVSNTLRVVMRDGDPWFVAADVCAAIGIGNTTDALRRLDDDEQALDSIEGISRGNDQANIINESGLYSLILGSRKPEAKKFKKWVTSEVLPAIRKTGSYTHPAAQPAQPPAHVFVTANELALIREAVANVARYFRFHLSAAITQAIYAPVYSAYGIERIADLHADKLPEVLSMLKDMETLAHGWYLAASQQEKQNMQNLGQKRIAVC